MDSILKAEIRRIQELMDACNDQIDVLIEHKGTSVVDLNSFNPGAVCDPVYEVTVEPIKED